MIKITNTADIKNFKHRRIKKPPKCAHFNIPASLCHQTSCNKPGPLAKVREMNPNAAKNHVSISAHKLHVRCWNNICPLMPKCPLTGSKMFVQNFWCRQPAEPRSREHEIFTKCQQFADYIMLSRFVNTEREQMAGFCVAKLRRSVSNTVSKSPPLIISGGEHPAKPPRFFIDK